MSMLTLAQTYDQLRARWTGSFSVDIVVWHYDHLPHDPPAVRYRIWDGAHSKSYEGPTLDVVLTLALADTTGTGGDDLFAAERSREGLDDGSEHPSIIPLTVVKS